MTVRVFWEDHFVPEEVPSSLDPPCLERIVFFFVRSLLSELLDQETLGMHRLSLFLTLCVGLRPMECPGVFLSLHVTVFVTVGTSDLKSAFLHKQDEVSWHALIEHDLIGVIGLQFEE